MYKNSVKIYEDTIKISWDSEILKTEIKVEIAFL